MNYRSHSKGISLVETLVSIAIMALLVLCATALLTTTSGTEKRNRAVTEVEWQASALMAAITQSVRNASAITSPATGATSTSLTLTLSGVPAESPTVYSTTSQILFVSKAGGAATRMSSSAVNVTSLSFQNITPSGTKGAVRITMTISSNNPNNKTGLTYSTTRTTTVTLR